MPQPVVIEIKKGQDGAAERHAWQRSPRRRTQRRNHSQQIREKDENRDGANKWDELLRAVPHVFLEQVLNAEAQRVAEQHFRNLLHRAGPLDRKARPQNKCKADADNKNDQGHHDVFGDGSLVVGGLQTQGMKQPQGQGPEDMVKPQRDLAYVFFHLVPGRYSRGCRISYTLTARVAAPSAHKPKIMLKMGTFRYLKIT